MSDSKRGELILLMLYRSRTHAQGEEASVRACVFSACVRACVCVCEIKTHNVAKLQALTEAHNKTGWKG